MDSGGLKVETRDGVRILTLANPPSNMLTPALRARLIEELAAAGTECHRIVLAGAGVTFSGAVPLDPDLSAPSLADLCAAVDASPIPVVAALHGLVTGPGAELALAAAARIAAPGTRVAWPEVALGLCPEGGTTLRLPRLVGVRKALGILLSGRAVPATEALALGLIDAVIDSGAASGPLSEGDAPVTAALAHKLQAAVPRLVRPDPAALAEARQGLTRTQAAFGRIIACVEAASLLPPEAHQAFEIVSREDLEASPEAAALRSAARAERRAMVLPPALARLRPALVDRIALHGADPGLVTLARLALAQGVGVDWHHPDDGSRSTSLAALAAAEAAEQRAGRLTAAARATGRTLLHDGGAATGLAAASLHIHDRPHGWDSGQPGVAGTVHLTLGGAEDGMGLALTPAGRICELSLAQGTSPEASAFAFAGLRRIGLQPVLVGSRPIVGQGLVTAGRVALAHLARTGVAPAILDGALEGFGVRRPEALPQPETDLLRDMDQTEVVARWLGALANEGLRLLEQGIARRPSDIDHVMVAGHGFPRWQGGPMHQADRRGLMLLRRDLRLWAEADPLWEPAPLLDRLIGDGQRLADLDRRS
ncbi:MAG: enoyl-CoA hydratase-related protein [Rhodobacterales bacterium]|nr:enoyl-CoA hydratase-related protein [Rhodobacterales bacterium]